MKAYTMAVPMVAACLILASGCRQPQEETSEPGVPSGAVPAAPDVRPGTESAPGGVAPEGGAGAAGDRAMPSDTAASASGDTTG